MTRAQLIIEAIITPGWWVEPGGKLHALPEGETHAQWALDHAASVLLDDGDFEVLRDEDPEAAMERVLEEMLHLGWMRLASNGETLWMDKGNLQITLSQLRAAKSLSVELGQELKRARS